MKRIAAVLFSVAVIGDLSAAKLRITERDFVFRQGKDYRISLELVLSEDESETIKPEPLWGAFEFVRRKDSPNMDCYPIMQYKASGVNPIGLFSVTIGAQTLDAGIRRIVVLDAVPKNTHGLFITAIPDPDNCGYTDVFVDGEGAGRADDARRIEINTKALPPDVEWLGSHPGDDESCSSTMHHLLANHGTELFELRPEHFRNLPPNYPLQRLLLAPGAASAPIRGASRTTAVVPSKPNLSYAALLADPNYKLEIAMARDDLTTADALLDAGADANKDYAWNVFNPLSEAAAGNKVQFIRLFLVHGAQVDGPMSMQRTTPLMEAAEAGAAAAFDLLLQWGADYKLRSTADWNVLAYAAHNPFGAKMLAHIAAHHPEIVAEPESLNEALLAAVDAGASQCVEKLLELGADVNTRDKSDETPLICTCRWGYAKVARILLRAGADVNARDNWNNTALYEAVSGDNPKTVKVLLAAGADQNIRPRSSPPITPLELAREKRYREIVHLLASHMKSFRRHGPVR